jgi:probable HAF family extracellular repeat protein
MIPFRTAWRIFLGLVFATASAAGGLLLMVEFDRQTAGPADVPVRFRCVRIDTPRDRPVSVLGLNDGGIVVGRWGESKECRAFAVVPVEGGYRSLDLNAWLPADSAVELRRAVGVNNAGQICGTANREGDDENSPRVFRATIVSGRSSGLRDFALLVDAAGKPVVGKAAGINSRGDVNGWYDPSPEEGRTNEFRDGRRCFVWSANGFRDVGEPPGGLGQRMTGLNDAGQFVCGSLDGSAFRYEPGRRDERCWTRIGIDDNKPRTVAGNTINSAGDVAGWESRRLPSDLRTEQAIRFTRAAGYENLGTLGRGSSMAHGLNDGGYVVGQSLDARSETRAFLFHPSFGMQALDDLVEGPAPRLTKAVRIANGGQSGAAIGRIVAVDGNRRLFLLVPVD